MDDVVISSHFVKHNYLYHEYFYHIQGIYLSSFHKVCIHIIVDVRTGTTFERNGSLWCHHIIYGLKRENKKFKLKRSTVDSR